MTYIQIPALHIHITGFSTWYIFESIRYISLAEWSISSIMLHSFNGIINFDISQTTWLFDYQFINANIIKVTMWRGQITNKWVFSSQYIFHLQDRVDWLDSLLKGLYRKPFLHSISISSWIYEDFFLADEIFNILNWWVGDQKSWYQNHYVNQSTDSLKCTICSLA